MRTTLTLEPDVVHRLKERMTEQKTTLKEVVNDALRRGLVAAPEARPKKPFRVQARSLGFRPGIDANRLNQLLDELDAQEFAAKARRSRGRR